MTLLDEHGAYVMETLRLEGNFLFLVRKGVTLRLEFALSRDDATRVAETIR